MKTHFSSHKAHIRRAVRSFLYKNAQEKDTHGVDMDAPYEILAGSMKGYTAQEYRILWQDRIERC